MFNKKWLVALAALYSSFSVSADVTITELMPCNISTYINDQYNYAGWAEFYNSGKSSVNLKGATISQYKKKGALKWSWTVDYDLSISAGGYGVIFFDKIEGKNHAPYKIDSDGGKLEIVMADGTSHLLSYTAQIPHKSYGIYDGQEGYMEPTPKKANTQSYPDLAYACATPTFGGVNPGVYEEASGTITLSCQTEGAAIYYTKDGSEPTVENGILYEEPIEFNKTRVLRAKAFLKGMLSSPIATASFILYGEEHTRCTSGERVPVISIVAEDRFFYSDDLGIYVKGSNGIEGAKSCVEARANYNRDWQRAVNVEWFDGSRKMSQEAEVAVMGGCSREHNVKSLKITTNKKVGAVNFGYNTFEDQEDKSLNLYASYQLRNGGNAHQEGKVRMRDGFMQSIAKGMKNIDYQAYQPVAYYLNGEYKGLMGMRERTNKEFVYSNYGLDEDDIDVVEMASDHYNASSGDLEAYERMVNYVKDNYDKENFISGVSSLMDIDEYLNYMIFEQFIVNTDWPSNNCKLWRNRDGGKFRWILYDTDFGLGLFESYSPNFCDPNNNMIEWCMGKGSKVSWGNGDGDTYSFTEATRWKTILFGSLMKNEEFKQMYLTKSLIHLANSLSYSRIEAVWDSIYAITKNEFCATYQYGNLKDEAAGMLSFAKKRGDVIYGQLADLYDLDNELVDFKVSSSFGNASFFVNGLSVANSFSMKCMKGMTVKLSANLPDGYKVSKWKVGTETYTTATVELTVDAKTTVELVVAEDASVPAIFINEVCAKNTIKVDAETGETSDWIELYNAGDEPVDVAGLYLSDKEENPQLQQIARGYASTIIPAKGHLLLWADGYAESGPLHLGFKLSDTSGEVLTLSKNCSTGLKTIDKIDFGTIGENASYGRQTDGNAKFKIFTECMDGTTETTPGAANGSVDCDSVLKANTTHISLSSNDIKAVFQVNGTWCVNPIDYLAKKNEELVIDPYVPEDATFKYWESSVYVPVETPLLTSADKWSYFYADSVPDGEWWAKSYSTTAWSTGKGRFGYATDSRKYDTALDYGEDSKNKYFTAYFRNSFTVSSTQEYDSLRLTLTYDDGAVVYLNGKELKRFNMPGDSIGYDTPSVDYVDDQVATIMLPKSKISASGTNVLAVEVHQYNSSSSDMTFACNVDYIGKTNRIYDEILTLTPTEDMTLVLQLDCPERTSSAVVARQQVSVLPNPVETTTSITATENISSISVYSMQGRAVMRIFPSEASETYQLDAQSLKSGSYLLQVVTEKGVYEGRLLKK